MSHTIRNTAAGVLVLSLVGGVNAATFDNNWQSNLSVLTFNDARTDDNQFAFSSEVRWTIDPGADIYSQEVYERPTIQSFDNVSGTPAFKQYFEPLDIVSGRFANDIINGKAYFSIDLVGLDVIDQDGSVSTTGLKHFYRVRVGDNADFAEGYMFGIKDPNGNSSGTFSQTATQSWVDTPSNGFVTGTGLTNTGEGGVGYDELTSEGSSSDIQARIVGNSVEIAVAYADLGIDPSQFTYLIFEATQGLTDVQNYFWNDEYNLSEAGSPYDPSNPPQNIYELDTLSAVVPVPAAAPLFAGAFGLLGLLGWRKRQAA